MGLSSPIRKTYIPTRRAISSAGKPAPGRSSGGSARISFSVMVPVLSTQSTSTRASVSIPLSSWIRVCRLASRITPTASATLVSKYSPSGIIPTNAATVETTAS